MVILISSHFKLVQDWLIARTAQSQKKCLGGPCKKSQGTAQTIFIIILIVISNISNIIKINPV